MFYNCQTLTSLNITDFDTTNVTNMSSMFFFCNHLVTISVSSNFITTSVTSSNNMFRDCTSLVGGNGTSYTSSYIDVTYARPDGWSYNTNTSTWVNDGSPGYFTLVT